MENIPERLVQRLRWTQGTSPKVPPSGPIIVLLYAGKEDPTSLDSCLHANYPHLSSMVVAVDILRSGPKGDHDMLQPELYGALCTAAEQGRVVFIGGGPNCRTWSILRHIPKPGPPTPVCGRTPETLWGLPHLQCRLGQLVKKATTLATDLPIQDWDQMRCTHQSHVSSPLSRYPWDMMAGLAKQSHRCVTRSAGAHPDPLTISGKP